MFKLFSLMLFPLISFGLEPQQGWGLKLKSGEEYVKIGGRLQGIAEHNPENQGKDMYLRRTRVNLVFVPWEGHKFVYDVRNDNANREDRGNGSFEIGDAYWQIKTSFPTVDNFRLFRAKVDVSYSQTSSSKNLLNPNRALPAEAAADFIVAGRRAVNAQVNGNIGRLRYHFAISDGVNSDDLEALNSPETSIRGINYQNFTYGGKLRYYFIGSADENFVQDTFYGSYDALSLGIGYFANDKINIDIGGGEDFNLSRELTNVELSYSQGPFRLLAEYFGFGGIISDFSDSDGVRGKGEYLQAEYLFGKIAPYMGFETLDRWIDEDGYASSGYYGGINYYDLMEARRYGIAFKSTDNQEFVGDDIEERAYVYAMLNF